MGVAQYFYSAIDSQKRVWSWGCNHDAEIGGIGGYLGDNTNTDRSSPVLVVGNHSFIMLARCYVGQAALKVNGEVWTWGYGYALGDNTTTYKSSPVLVVGGHSFTVISGSGYCFHALKSNGEVWGWGNNDYGQLGDNTKTSYSSPILVIGNHSFIDVIGGGNHCLALKADGSLWAWGNNAWGQLGDNTRTNTSSPILVIGGHSFIQVGASGESFTAHSIALKSNGEAWSWGRNWNGQLGDNTAGSTNSSKSSPVLVVGNHSFIKVAAGKSYSSALKSNGEIWSWGMNNSGWLGDNTDVDKSSPVLVAGNHSFIDVSREWTSTYALKSNGQIWSWGNGINGELGNNTTTGALSPVLVVGSIPFIALNGLLQSRVGDTEFDWEYRSIIFGTTCWGHITGVTETNVRTLADNWIGTGAASGSGDAEILTLDDAEYMESEVVETGIEEIELLQNIYQAGDDGVIYYKTGVDEADCVADSWHEYLTTFISEGFVQVRVEA